MAETVIIDIEAQYRDRTSAGVKGSTDELERMRKKLGETETGAKKAEASLAKIAATAKTIAKSAITIPVKIADYATRPLRGLINYATSLKGILTGIVMGQAGKALVGAPIQLADTLKGHELAFENLLGSQEKAAQMIRDIQAFDEKSPFNTMQIIEQSRMLMTYKLADEKNVLSMIETIGDAAMGVGAGDQGIERIVRSLGQMKAKGKVSAEEMLQLSEVNISGWQYLADAYGKTTAEIQAMTAKNLIPVEDAITALLTGMKKDFGGMANSNAMKTLGGVKGQIESIIENGPKLQWGLGLREGTMAALTRVSGWLNEAKPAVDDLGKSLYTLGKDISTKAADEFIEFGERVKEVLGSDEFRNAKGWGGKLRFAWDKIIAEPFDEWWSSKGEAFLGDVAGKFGDGLGKFYKGSILTILGIDTDKAAEGGLSIGAKFAEGFLEGFDPAKVWDAVQQAFGRMVRSAGKVLPGGEKADAGSYLSAALLGLGAAKLYGLGKPLVGGIAGLAGLGGGAAGAGAAVAAGGGGLFAGMSTMGIAGGAGALAGGLGLLSAMADWRRAERVGNSKEKNVAGWSAASKAGMVGLGAAIGTAILPGLGSAIGAGIGGLGALFAGGKAGRGISDAIDGTGEIKKAAGYLDEASAAADKFYSKGAEGDRLIRQYEDINRELKDGKLGTDDMAAAQAEQRDIISKLAQIYPDLIDQYTIENDKLSERLGLIKDLNKADKEQALRDAEVASYEFDQQKDKVEEKLRGAMDERDSQIADYERLKEGAYEIKPITAKIHMVLGDESLSDEEREKALAGINKDVEAFNEKYGTSYTPWDIANVDQYKSMMDQATQAKRAADETKGQVDELMATYEAGFANKVNEALLKSDVDVTEAVGKMQELKTVTAEVSGLQAKMNGMEKGSEEYEETAKKLDEAKGKQKELHDAVDKFKVPLQEVIDKIRDIRREFGLLPTEIATKYTVEVDMADKYLHPTDPRVALQEAKQAANKYESLPMAYASGTTSAPAGLAWVGEEGPELIRLRGGERIYNADDSRRIAEQTARSHGGGAAAAATPPLSISLGGINVDVHGGANEDVMAQIREKLPEIGNELCAMIAVEISKIYANMPTRVEGIA